MAKEWYVLHTFSGYENKVKLALEKMLEASRNQQQIESSGGQYSGENYRDKSSHFLHDILFQGRIPTIDVPEVKDGKRKVKSKKFLPGYILLEIDLIDNESWVLIWSKIKKIQGATGFVGTYGTELKSTLPKSLTREEVNSLFDQMGEQKTKEKASLVMDFNVGEHIKVIDGPFNNFSGIVEEVFPEKGRLRVKVEIFGRGTPVELDFVQVGKI